MTGDWHVDCERLDPCRYRASDGKVFWLLGMEVRAVVDLSSILVPTLFVICARFAYLVHHNHT